MWYWCREKQIDHWDKIESQETDSPIFSHMFYDKVDSAVQWAKGPFQHMVLDYLNVQMEKIMNLDHYPTPYRKINFRYDVDINKEQ